MPNRSKEKGSRFEREIVAVLQTHGIAAERVPLSGSAGGSFGGDINCPVMGIDRKLECKVRKRGFATLYGYMGNNYAVVLKDDRCPPLVVLRMDDWCQLVAGRT